jgi:capsid protein
VTTKAIGQTGREVSPLAFDDDSLRALHSAAVSGQSLRIKAFSSPDSQLPAQLYPVPIGPAHENRLLDRLPTMAITAPSMEYIRHSSTSGAAAVVAEGGLKPEIVMNTTPMTATAQKIAAHVGTSWEAISDWSNWTSYVQGELFRQVIDVETSELLGGNGTTGHLTGLLHTSGILTHDASADTGTNVTALDSV